MWLRSGWGEGNLLFNSLADMRRCAGRLLRCSLQSDCSQGETGRYWLAMQWLIHYQLQNVPAFGLQIWNAMFSLLFVKCNYLCCYPTANLQIRRWDVGDTDSRLQTDGIHISPSASLLPSRPCLSARTRAEAWPDNVWLSYADNWRWAGQTGDTPLLDKHNPNM